MNQQNKIYKIGLDFKTISKLQGNNYTAYDNNAQVDYVYAPFLTSDVIYVRYIPEKYFTAQNIVPIPLGYMTPVTDQDTIDDILVDQVQVSGYSLFKRAVNSDVTGINDTLSNMALSISFKQTQLTSSSDYLGYKVYTSLTDTQINAALKLAYASAVTDNFVNVLSLPADTYTSWEFDGTDFIKQN